MGSNEAERYSMYPEEGKKNMLLNLIPQMEKIKKMSHTKL